MEKIKTIIQAPLFRSGCAAAIGIALLTESHPLYAGMGFGIAIREFLLAFASE